MSGQVWHSGFRTISTAERVPSGPVQQLSLQPARMLKLSEAATSPKFTGSGLIWRSNWSENAGPISRPGLMPSTSPPGCASHQATKSPAARCCPHEPDDLAAGPRHYCGLPRLRSGALRPRWAHSIGVCPHVSARPRRSLPPPAKSPFCSTIRCVTVWNTAIREPPITRRVTADASSPISNEGQSRSAIPYSPRQRPAECFLGIPQLSG